MPIYEYTCADCGKTFDFLARTLKDKPEVCPTCKGTNLKKAFSTFQADVKSQGGCPHAGGCGHVHGPGCGCCH